MFQSKLFRINDWPIAVKLVSAMILISVLPLAIVSVINNVNTASSLRSQIGESFAEVAVSTMDEVSHMLSENVHLLQLVAMEAEVREMVEERNLTYTGTEAEIQAQISDLDEKWMAASDYSSLIRNVISDNKDVNPAGHALHDFFEFFPQHAEVFITDMYGANVASTGRTSDYYQADEGWWQATWNDGAGDVYIGDPEFDESAGITALNMGVPISNHDGEVIGVLRSTLNIEEILAIVSETQIGETGHMTLVDRNGIVIADPHPEHIGTTLPENILNSDVLAEEVAHWDELLDEDGEMAIIGHAKIHLKDSPAVELLYWTGLASITSSEALAPVTTSTRLALISGFIALLAAIGLAVLVTRGLTGQVNRIMDLFGRVGMGEYGARAEVVSADELGNMATSLNAMLDNTLDLIQTREERDTMQSSIQKLLDEVSGVAEGDLTLEAEVTADLTGSIADAFNFMIVQLRDIISGVQDATLQVSSSANEIQVTTEHLSQGSESQARQISDTSVALEEMAASIQQVSENATLSAEVGNESLTNAQRGVKAVQDTMDGMNRIRDQVQETAKRIKRLGESSQEIGEIVQLIGDIADRTSILALNASIQAAMAGEAGQGFAVVAEEVERLAERATESTKQIDTLIRTIQNEMNEAVTAMEMTTNEVVEGSQLAEEAGAALTEIGKVSDRLAELIQSISMAAKQQARGSENLAVSMSEIAGVTQQTAAGTKQAAVSISHLASLADDLRDSVSAFRLPGSNGQNPE